MVLLVLLSRHCCDLTSLIHIVAACRPDYRQEIVSGSAQLQELMTVAYRQAPACATIAILATNCVMVV